VKQKQTEAAALAGNQLNQSLSSLCSARCALLCHPPDQDLQRKRQILLKIEI
jgi:hypothetical protein